MSTTSRQVDGAPASRSPFPFPLASTSSTPPPPIPQSQHQTFQQEERYLPPGAAYANRTSPQPLQQHRTDNSSSPSTSQLRDQASYSQYDQRQQDFDPVPRPSSQQQQNQQKSSKMLQLPTLSIGSERPLVESSEWPTGSSPLTHNNSPYPASQTPTSDNNPSNSALPPLVPSLPPISTAPSSPAFAGIPSGRIQSSSAASSPRQTQSAHFPSFVPSPNFSSTSNNPSRNEDRGPYPPHVRSQSTGMMFGRSQAAMNDGREEMSEFLAVDRSQIQTQNLRAPISREQSLSPANRPLSVADMVVGTPPPEATSPMAYDRRSYLEDSTTPVTPSDMAGIGRNSIIRSAGGGANEGGRRQGSASPTTSTKLQLAPQPQTPREIIPATLSPQQRNSISAFQQLQNSGGGGGGATSPLPPHLIPQPEVCVECMMRDRDMADVDVTTMGVWDRDSDVDWKEQLRWEEENPEFSPPSIGSHQGSVEHVAGSVGSQESGFGGRRRGSAAASYSRESTGSRNGLQQQHLEKRRRLGRGQALTSGNLKVQTTMSPPAAAHRWRTLQKFLATQIHLLELDRQAREAGFNPSNSDQRNPFSQTTTPRTQSRSRSSSVQPAPTVAQQTTPMTTTPEPFEHQREGGRGRAKSGSRGYLVDQSNRQSSASSLFPPQHSQSLPQPISANAASGTPPYPTHPQYIHPSLASSGVSIQSYSYGDQPWLSSQARRYSSPYMKDGIQGTSPPKSPAPSGSSMRFNLPKFARSTTDLRSISTPRSISPARNSLNVDYDDRRRSSSLWSKFRNSTSNQSVLSFNPSASMMDMHLGLSQDKHGAGYASSTIGALGGGGQRGYSYHQTPYDTYSGGLGGGALSMSDPAVARHAELRERDRALAKSQASRASETASKKDKKKKGIKGFFSKLVGGGGSGSDKAESKSRNGPYPHSAPTTPATEVPFAQGGGRPTTFDDDELAPPPPLSALANEPRYHQRSSSTSSVDSFTTGPYTPPLHPANFRSSYTMPMPLSNSNIANAADRQSIISYSSARSKPPQQQPHHPNDRLNASRDSMNRPSFDSLREPLAAQRMSNPIDHQRDERGSPEILVDEGNSGMNAGGIGGPDGSYSAYPVPQPRLQKSLPSLPNEMSQSQPRSSRQDYPNQPHQGNFYTSYQPGASRSAYSLVQFPSRPLSPPDSADESRYASVNSRNGRKTRSTVFSFFGRKKSGDAIDGASREDLTNQRAASFDMVSRY
ncbi:hypothetical protein JCM5353_006660 [Sporobolomyces roseus]